MSRVERSRREKVTRYSVRKVSFGAASVAVAAFFMFLGNGAVYAAEPNVTATDSALAATPANNQLDENSGASDSTAPKAQAGTTTPTPVDASSTSVESAPASKVQADTTTSKPADATPAPVVLSTTSTIEEKSAEKNTEASSAEANSVENKQQTTVKAEEPSTTSSATKPAEVTATTESNKPKSRKKRSVDASPTAPNTTSDEAANKVYIAPGLNAGLDELKEKLEQLPSEIQNNTKINNMNELGDNTNTPSGQVQNIKEFGGWKAVGENGKFAIAKKTDAGVFPIETVNTVYAQNRDGSNKHYETYTGEQAFDRTANYMLFLSEVRTHASASDGAYDGSTYQGTGLFGATAKAVKNYDGIEKTFKAYSAEVGSKVKIRFKTGYTGDINGTKAKYKVEVITNKNGNKEIVYSKIFDPQKDLKDDEAIVTKARDGNGKFIRSEFNDRRLNKTEVESKMTGAYIPTGTAGTFTSKDIDLGEGVTEYTVRISSADNEHLGMGYQSPLRQYALPISGLDFNITQDTNKIAKDLLTKVYTKLTEQKAEDTKWSTPETKAIYEAKLQAIQEALTSDASTTDSYKTVAIAAVAQQKKLNEEEKIKNKSKAAVAAALAAKEKAIEGNSKLSEAEKTAAKAEAKKAADDATNAIEAAKDQAGVDAKETAGTEAVAAVNPVGKDNAKAAVAAALAAKEKAIEGNSKLSEAEKTAAKEEAKKAADEAKKAIDAATDQAGVDAKATEGTDAVAAVNPVGKDKAKAAVDAALAEKDKAIDANDKLSDAEKSAAKAQVAAEAKKAIEAIEKATTEADVEAAKEAGKAEIAKVAPETTDYKAKAKAEVEAELAKKLAELENATDLTEAEKAAAKLQVVNKAKEAIEAIQKAATEADVDQAIRNFVYRISAVIREQEEYDLSKLFVNGSVTVKQGESLTDKDVLSKLNLPSGVEIVKVEKPTTSALGTVMAKVTVKLADGSVEEINVPVEVIVSQNHGNEGNGANNGANNTEAKVNKAKLEGAIHQLDELLLKESAKLDAETAKEANVLSADAKKVFANADATQAEVDAMVKRIEDFMAKVAPLTDHVNTANDQSAQTPAVVPANNQSAQTTVVAPATTQAAANASQTLSAQANARKAAKELPNTGTVDSTVAMVAAAASALLGLGLVGRRRKEDEEA